MELKIYEVESDGFALASAVLPVTICEAWTEFLGPVEGAGRRDLLEESRVRDLAGSPELLGALDPYFAEPPFPVRAIYFNKSLDANWPVLWHQDLTIAVRERAEVSGYGPWSTKDGVCHVQPPVEVLEGMLTLRLHLDVANEANGALRILPGTHRMGRLGTADISRLRGEKTEVTFRSAVGDVLLMRPLLLHASSRSTVASPRRVLHIEYACGKLPGGLQWHNSSLDKN